MAPPSCRVSLYSCNRRKPDGHLTRGGRRRPEHWLDGEMSKPGGCLKCGRTGYPPRISCSVSSLCSKKPRWSRRAREAAIMTRKPLQSGIVRLCHCIPLLCRDCHFDRSPGEDGDCSNKRKLHSWNVRRGRLLRALSRVVDKQCQTRPFGPRRGKSKVGGG